MYFRSIQFRVWLYYIIAHQTETNKRTKTLADVHSYIHIHSTHTHTNDTDGHTEASQAQSKAEADVFPSAQIWLLFIIDPQRESQREEKKKNNNMQKTWWKHAAKVIQFICFWSFITGVKETETGRCYFTAQRQNSSFDWNFVIGLCCWICWRVRRERKSWSVVVYLQLACLPLRGICSLWLQDRRSQLLSPSQRTEAKSSSGSGLENK